MSIRLDNISVCIGGHLILDRIDASFSIGQLTCVIGPNGAGKTTLLKTVIGEVQPRPGRVIIDEAGDDTHSYRCFAFSPQTLAPPGELTAYEMVQLGRFDPGRRWWSRPTATDRRLIEESLVTVGINHLAHRKNSSLSGGELQRVWIAFCLAQDKPYLLLDESLSAIDFVSRWDYFKLLSSLANTGRGIVLVTHDIGMVNEFADSVLLLVDGAVRYSGPTGHEMNALLRELNSSISPNSHLIQDFGQTPPDETNFPR